LKAIFFLSKKLFKRGCKLGLIRGRKFHAILKCVSNKNILELHVPITSNMKR
jgi:hypothetical protein